MNILAIRMPSRRTQTPVPVRVTRNRRRSLDELIRRLEGNIDDLLRLLELAQGHVSSLRRQITYLQREIKTIEENYTI